MLVSVCLRVHEEVRTMWCPSYGIMERKRLYVNNVCRHLACRELWGKDRGTLKHSLNKDPEVDKVMWCDDTPGQEHSYRA